MRASFLDKLNVFFDRWGSENIPLSYGVGTFFAATILRTFLEHVVLSSGFSMAWGEDLAHYTLSYVALALTFILLFHYLTGDRVARVARIVLPGFIILNIVPLIDRLTGAYTVNRIAYLLPDLTPDIVGRFFTFFGPLEKFGVTLGMRVEIALMIVAAFVYVLARTGRVWRAAAGAFLFYGVTFAYIAMPFAVRAVFLGLGLDGTLDMPVMINWFLVLIVFLGVAAAYVAARPVFMGVMADIRATRLWHYLLWMAIGAAFHARYVMMAAYWDRDVLFRAFFLVMAVVLAWLFSVVSNNWADRDIDRVSNPDRPLVTGCVPEAIYRRLGWGALAGACFFAFMAGIKPFEIVLVFIGNYFLYSMPPLRLKRVPVLSKLVIGINSLLAFMLGYTFFVQWAKLPAEVILFFVVFLTASANFIDLKDHEGDRLAGICTLPVLIGMPLAQKLIGAAFVLTYLAAYVVFRLEGFFLVCLMAGAVQFFLINRRVYDERPVLLVHVLSLVFIAGYVLIAR